MPRTGSHSSGSGESNSDNNRASKEGPQGRNDVKDMSDISEGSVRDTTASAQDSGHIEARESDSFEERHEANNGTAVITTGPQHTDSSYGDSSRVHLQTTSIDATGVLYENVLPAQQRLSTTSGENEILPTNREYDSEDGTSLSDPRSSEAETEHILSDHEEDTTSAMVIDDDVDEEQEEVDSEDDENDLDSLEAPDDLDNLSDIVSDEEDMTGVDDAEQDTRPQSIDDIDITDNAANEPEHNTANSSPQSAISGEDAERDGADIMVSLGADTTSGPQDKALQGPSSPPRKRKRSTETSPIATKRLAPRKVQADLDSDEEDETSSPKHALISALTGQRDEIDDTQDAQTATPGDQSLLSKDIEQSPKLDEAVEEIEEEMVEEEDEPEEEVQDDTEREERNRHRQAAMDALRNIEVEFAHLRAKLFEERMIQIEREIALADQGEHPLLVEKASQNRSRHSGRLSRAEVLRERRRAEAEIEFKAHKFIAHSQFAQDKQKLRATLLSRTSAEWFQIHREKRVLDMAVPEYGYLVPDRKSIQLKNRRDLEAEISNLASLKKLIGFPAAPAISVASPKDIDADLADMGLSKGLGIAARDHQRSSHATLSSQLGNQQASHTHSQQGQATSNNKVHQHRKKNQESKALTSGQSDPHNMTPSQQSKIVSPQAPHSQQLPNHSYQHELSRKPNALPAVYNPAPNHEPERKPSMFSATTDAAKNREHDREQLPFPSAALPHIQSSAFSQPQLTGGSTQFQKQAQNLPNILRQDTPDRNKQLPALSQLSKGGLPSSHDSLGGVSHSKSFTSQFWNSKMTDTNRQPAPAVSSNSAFNATLSQPGISAAYIPPKTYSPAAQTQNSVFKPSTSLQSMNQANTTNKGYPPSHHFAGQAQNGKEGTAESAQLYKPQHHIPNENHRNLFNHVSQPPIKQEQQQQHQ